jgi:hypothetical protein
MDGWMDGRLDDGQRFRKNTTVNEKERRGRRVVTSGTAGQNDRPSRSNEEEEEDITNPKFAFVFPLSKFLITAASGLHPCFLLARARSLARSLPPSPRLLLLPPADPTSVVLLFVFLVLLLLLVLYTFLWCSPTELSSAHDLPSIFVSLGTVTKSSLFLLLRNNFVVSAPQKFCCFCFSQFFLFLLLFTKTAGSCCWYVLVPAAASWSLNFPAVAAVSNIHFRFFKNNFHYCSSSSTALDSRFSSFSFLHFRPSSS